MRFIFIFFTATEKENFEKRTDEILQYSKREKSYVL